MAFSGERRTRKTAVTDASARTGSGSRALDERETLFDTHGPIVLRRTGPKSYAFKRWPDDFPCASDPRVMAAYDSDFDAMLAIIPAFLALPNVDAGDTDAVRFLATMIGAPTEVVHHPERTRTPRRGIRKTAWGEPEPGSQPLTPLTLARSSRRGFTKAQPVAGPSLARSAAPRPLTAIQSRATRAHQTPVARLAFVGGSGNLFEMFVSWMGMDRRRAVYPAPPTRQPPFVAWVPNPMHDAPPPMPMPMPMPAPATYMPVPVHHTRMPWTRKSQKKSKKPEPTTRDWLLHADMLIDQQQQQRRRPPTRAVARSQKSARGPAADVCPLVPATDLTTKVGEGGNGCVYLDRSGAVATKLFDPTYSKDLRVAFRLLRDRVGEDIVRDHFVVPSCVSTAAVASRVVKGCAARHLREQNTDDKETGFYKMTAAIPLYVGSAAWADLLPAFAATQELMRGGLVHGDLKTDNMLVEGGVVKLCDLDGLFKGTMSLDPRVNFIAGTPDYFLTPPEFILNGTDRRLEGIDDIRDVLKKTLTHRLKSRSVFHAVDKLPRWERTRYNAYGWLTSQDANPFVFVTLYRRVFRDRRWTVDSEGDREWTYKNWPWDKYDIYGLGIALLEVALRIPDEMRVPELDAALDMLIAGMIHCDPLWRTSADEALEQFRTICGTYPMAGWGRMGGV